MVAPAIQPGARSYWGIGKETTPGTGVIPLRYIPFEEFSPVDDPHILEDKGVRGSMTGLYGTALGPLWSTASWKGKVFMDTTGDLVYNTTGDYAVSGTGPYTHTFSTLNSGNGQPVTHTWTDYQGLTASTGARTYPYACVEELTFTGNAEQLFDLSGKSTHLGSAAAGATPTNALTAELVQPSWESTVTINGVAATNVAEWTVTMQRQLIVKPVANGSQAPFVIARGELNMSGKLTFVAIDESPFTQHLSNTVQPLVITVNNGLTGAAQRTFTFQATKANYKKSALKRGPLLGWENEFQCIGNTTDAGASGGESAGKITLLNGITTY